MNNHRHTWKFFGITVTCCLALLMIFAIGCGKKTETSTPDQQQAAANFVNDRCPIMSTNKINPTTVTEKLTRTYDGKKVAFCCAGCPTAWDKLSDTEKTAKLAVVLKK